GVEAVDLPRRNGKSGLGAKYIHAKTLDDCWGDVGLDECKEVFWISTAAPQDQGCQQASLGRAVSGQNSSVCVQSGNVVGQLALQKRDGVSAGDGDHGQISEWNGVILLGGHVFNTA